MGRLIICYFIAVSLYVAYELHRAPHLDKKGRIVKKRLKTGNLIDSDKKDKL